MTLFMYSSLPDPYLLIKCYASLQITESDLIKIVMLMFKDVLHGNLAPFPPWVLYYCKKENIMGLLAGLHWFLFENTSIAEFNSWKPQKNFEYLNENSRVLVNAVMYFNMDPCGYLKILNSSSHPKHRPLYLGWLVRVNIYWRRVQLYITLLFARSFIVLFWVDVKNKNISLHFARMPCVRGKAHFNQSHPVKNGLHEL